jgi:hypothetical protein
MSRSSQPVPRRCTIAAFVATVLLSLPAHAAGSKSSQQPGVVDPVNWSEVYNLLGLPAGGHGRSSSDSENITRNTAQADTHPSAKIQTGSAKSSTGPKQERKHDHASGDKNTAKTSSGKKPIHGRSRHTG